MQPSRLAAVDSIRATGAALLKRRQWDSISSLYAPGTALAVWASKIHRPPVMRKFHARLDCLRRAALGEVPSMQLAFAMTSTAFSVIVALDNLSSRPSMVLLPQRQRVGARSQWHMMSSSAMR